MDAELVRACRGACACSCAISSDPREPASRCRVCYFAEQAPQAAPPPCCAPFITRRQPLLPPRALSVSVLPRLMSPPAVPHIRPVRGVVRQAPRRVPASLDETECSVMRAGPPAASQRSPSGRAAQSRLPRPEARLAAGRQNPRPQPYVWHSMPPDGSSSPGPCSCSACLCDACARMPRIAGGAAPNHILKHQVCGAL